MCDHSVRFEAFRSWGLTKATLICRTCLQSHHAHWHKQQTAAVLWGHFTTHSIAVQLHACCQGLTQGHFNESSIKQIYCICVVNPSSAGHLWIGYCAPGTMRQHWHPDTAPVWPEPLFCAAFEVRLTSTKSSCFCVDRDSMPGRAAAIFLNSACECTHNMLL